MVKKHKEYDASKPLPNRRHETFAQELAKNPQANQTQAYLKVYPESAIKSAQDNASRLIGQDRVRERVMALMSKERPILDKVADRINAHIDGDNAPVSMDACKTVLKVAGALDEAKQSEASYNPVQINIIIEGKDTQSTMPIDVTATEP